MHCAFSRGCEARRPLHEILSLPLSLFLSLSLCPLALIPHHLSPSATSAFLSLSRQMATITYMCQYITHTASRASLASPSSTKCTTTSSRSFTLQCSRPIPHLPSLTIHSVVVCLPLSRFSRSSAALFVSFPTRFLCLSLLFFTSFPRLSFLR